MKHAMGGTTQLINQITLVLLFLQLTTAESSITSQGDLFSFNTSKAPILSFIIDCEAGKIIRLVASVRPSVRPFVSALLLEHKSIHIYPYQSKVFVCLSVISGCFDRLRHRGRSRF